MSTKHYRLRAIHRDFPDLYDVQVKSRWLPGVWWTVGAANGITGGIAVAEDHSRPFPKTTIDLGWRGDE